MKLVKLSLAAIAVVGLSTSSFAADTLVDAFKNGKVSGTLETQYITEDYKNNTQTNGFAVGGELKFKTDSFKGFGAGFTFETGHTLGTQDPAESDATVNIQKTLLSEAYLTYTMGKTSAKVGRQYIATPLVSVSGSRLMMDYFTAGIVVNKDLDKTTLVAGVVTEHINRNSTVTHLDSPVYTVYVKNNSVAGLTLQAQGTFNSSKDAGSNDGQDDLFFDAEYKLATDFPITVGAQYLSTTRDTGSDGSLYGVMAGTSFGALDLNVYYNNSTDDGAVSGGWGLGNDPSYNDMWIVNGLGANTESYSIQALYKVSSNLSAYAWYGMFDPDGDNNDFTDLDFNVNYKATGALKGMSLTAKYSIADFDKTVSPQFKGKESHIYFFAKYAF